MENRKGFGLVGLLIVLCIIVILGGGVFYGYQGGFFGGGTTSRTITGPIDAAKKAKDLLEQKNQQTVGGVSTADWKTYKNEEYGFEFKYPSSWTEKTTRRDSQTIIEIIGPESEIEVYGRFLVLSVTPREGVLTIEKWWAEESKTSRWERWQKIGEDLIGGLRSYRFILPDSDASAHDVFIMTREQGGVVTSYIYDLSLRAGDQDIQREIPASIKFLP